MRKLEWTPDLVRSFWDGVSGSRLLEHSAFYRTGGRHLFDFVGDHFRPGIDCLDIGAGDGDFAQAAAERGCRVGVFEPSEGRRQALLRKPFTQGERFLGFHDGASARQFDLVMAIEVIEHILDADMEGFIALLGKSLKPGGTLIVTTPNEEDLELNMAFCPVSGVAFHRWQHVRSFSRATLAEQLSPIGFAKVLTHRVTYTSPVGSDRRYWQLLGPVFPLVRPLIKAATRKFGRSRSLHIGNAGLIFVGVKA